MKYRFFLGGAALLLSLTGCMVGVDSDPGPAQTAKEEIDAGKADSVRAEIHMGAGQLHIDGGGTRLMTGSFRYSARVGRPTVRYEVAGAHGQLAVESPEKSSSMGRVVNEWNLRMGSAAPLEMSVNLGSGTADLDMSRLPLDSITVHVGAGETRLNVAGKYAKDVAVKVEGGAGEARIRLPVDMGAVVDATVGIGSIHTKGLTKRDGRYYNEAYAEGKPAVRVQVTGGVGDISLNVE